MSVVPSSGFERGDSRAISLQAFELSGERGGPVASYDDFEIPLFGIGHGTDCLFSYCCSPCALASARTYMDDSHWIYNFFCLGHVVERWMIRTAYGIAGSGGDDCAVACCCIPCSANQLYQTAKARGNPTVNGGRSYNRERFARPDDSRGIVRRFCCALFCNPCTTGAAMQTGVGMPFWMGCLCTNMCTARNIIRYQHRIMGHDFLDECVLPSLLLLATGASLFFLPLLICVAPVVVTRSMQLQAQAEARPSQSRRYLVNDSIRQVPVPVHSIEVVQPSVVTATLVSTPVARASTVYPVSPDSYSRGDYGGGSDNNMTSEEHQYQHKYGVGINSSNRSLDENRGSAAPTARSASQSPSPIPSMPVAVVIGGNQSRYCNTSASDLSVHSLS